MRNALAWILGLLHAKRTTADARALESAGADDLNASDAPALGPDPRAADALAMLDAVTRDMACGHARLQADLSRAVDGLQGLFERLEGAVSGRVADLGNELDRLREAIDHKFACLETRIDGLERRLDSAAEKWAETERGLSGLAETVGKGLEATERTLRALKESTEQRVSELRESQRRHTASLERSRDELLRAAKESRKRLTRSVEEVADFLEREVWPAVPPAEEETASVPERRRWPAPFSTLAAWLRRGTELRHEMSRLEKRTVLLEDLLRERWEESRRRGHMLRRALAGEDGALPPPHRDLNGARNEAKIRLGAAPALAERPANGNGTLLAVR